MQFHLQNTHILQMHVLQGTYVVCICADDTSDGEVQSDQQRAAARVIVLAVTLLTACDVHNTGPKADRVPADLGTAAWKVSRIPCVFSL